MGQRDAGAFVGISDKVAKTLVDDERPDELALAEIEAGADHRQRVAGGQATLLVKLQPTLGRKLQLGRVDQRRADGEVRVLASAEGQPALPNVVGRRADGQA